MYDQVNLLMFSIVQYCLGSSFFSFGLLRMIQEEIIRPPMSWNESIKWIAGCHYRCELDRGVMILRRPILLSGFFFRCIRSSSNDTGRKVFERG